MILTDEEVRAITSGALWSDAECHADLCAQVARATERAVLEKLREPTVAMLKAANCHPVEYCKGLHPIDEANRSTWRAMIDAATKAG